MLYLRCYSVSWKEFAINSTILRFFIIKFKRYPTINHYRKKKTYKNQNIMIPLPKSQKYEKITMYQYEPLAQHKKTFFSTFHNQTNHRINERQD